MTRKYWLDLFTGTTWEEFLEHGANISGFRASRKRMAERITPGDYLLCYLTGISRFVGILEVKSKCYTDTTPVWLDEIFPIRFDVELVEKLDAKTAVPVLSLKDELQLFKGLKSRNAWTGFFRGSPAEFCASDSKAIASAIKNAAKNPVELEYDERKYRRKTKTYDSKIGIVTVPEDHEEDPSKAPPGEGELRDQPANICQAQAASTEDLQVHPLLGTVEGDRADRKQDSLHEARVHLGDRRKLRAGLLLRLAAAIPVPAWLQPIWLCPTGHMLYA